MGLHEWSHEGKSVVVGVYLRVFEVNSEGLQHPSCGWDLRWHMKGHVGGVSSHWGSLVCL